MKFFTEEEILDKHIGKIGTPHRNQFEDEINTVSIQPLFWRFER